MKLILLALTSFACLSAHAATRTLTVQTNGVLAYPTNFFSANSNLVNAVVAGGGGGSGITQLTGDVTAGPGTGSQAATLASVGSAGTYRSVTTDAKGRVTAGTNPTTFSGYGLSDTSANLAAALTDETGTGAAVFGSSPTIVTPTIASFANAAHNHQNAAGGGTLDVAAIASGTFGIARGGTAKSSWTASRLLAGNTTSTPDEVILGTALSLSGSAGDGSRTLNATRTGVRRTLFVSAGAMIPRTTAGAAAGTTETTTNDIMYDSFDFDSTTEEGVGFWLAMPQTWDAGTLTFKLYWTATSGSGTVKWDIAARAFADDDALDQALGTEQGTTDTLLTASDMHISPTSSALTIGGSPAVGRPAYFQITRDTATDTLNADARLIGVQLEFTESSTEPSAQ